MRIVTENFLDVSVYMYRVMWPRPRSRLERVSFYVFALENAKALNKLFTYNNQNLGYLFRKRCFFNGFQKKKIFIGRGIKYIFHFPLSIKIYFSVVLFLLAIVLSIDEPFSNVPLVVTVLCSKKVLSLRFISEMSLRLTLHRMLDATEIPLQNGLRYR